MAYRSALAACYPLSSRREWKRILQVSRGITLFIFVDVSWPPKLNVAPLTCSRHLGSIEQHSQILLVADGIPSGTKHFTWQDEDREGILEVGRETNRHRPRPLRMFTLMNNLLSIDSGGNYSLLIKAGILTNVGARCSNRT